MKITHGLEIVGEALRTDEGKARLGRWYNAGMIGVLAAALAGSPLVQHLNRVYVAQATKAENLTRWADYIASFATPPGRLIIVWDQDPLRGADNATRAAHVAAVRKQADQAAGEAQNAVTWICRLYVLGFNLPSHFPYSCDL